jgi:hypothetical protein
MRRETRNQAVMVTSRVGGVLPRRSWYRWKATAGARARILALVIMGAEAEAETGGKACWTRRVAMGTATVCDSNRIERGI